MTTKNVYSHNDNNVWCFLWESLVWKEIMRMFSDLWVYVFNVIINVIIFSMKMDNVNVVEMGKNMWELYVRFFMCDYKLKIHK